MLHAGSNREGRGYELGLRDCYRQMEDSLAFHALAWGRNVIIDRTNLSRDSRRRWIDFADLTCDRLPGVVIEVIAVAFPVESPEVHARRRYESDPRGRSYEDWLAVARHHHEQHLAEPLGDDEGFDRIVRIGGPIS